jgi:hypothetical protein
MVTRLSPLRLGLSARLFAVLLLLGAIAVLISGGLGYISARDALEQSIYNQLTAARETKTHQVENYFRSTSNEIRLLANTQMVVEAMHDFRNAVDELDRTKVPDDVRNRVESWYDTHFMPMIRRQLGADAQVRDYLPIASAAYFLQDHYIIANPNRTGQRRALADAGDGSAYSRLHARYHPILRHATATLNLYDLMMIDPRDGRIVYSVTKETDFASSIKAAPYSHSNLAVAVAACSESADASKTCLGDFADYLPADGAPAAFMAAPLIEKGVVIGVLVARLSINELDNIVSGRRQWSHEGFGTTGEAYLVGPDFLIRSAPRLFFENRDQYFEELERGGTTPKNDIEDTHRYGSPVLQQHVDNKATRAALSGLEGIGAIPGTGGQVTLASWGPVSVPGLQWGMIAKIDDAEAFAPVHLLQRRLIIVGTIALLVVLSTGAWLSTTLPVSGCAPRTRSGSSARRSTAWSTSCGKRASSSTPRTGRMSSSCSTSCRRRSLADYAAANRISRTDSTISLWRSLTSSISRIYRRACRRLAWSSCSTPCSAASTKPRSNSASKR